MRDITRLPRRSLPRTLAGATEAFLDQADLAATSTRVYAPSLSALNAGLGPDRRLDDLPPGDLARWFAGRYRSVAPATWNRELATLRSAIRWWATQGWVAGDPTDSLARRREHPDRTRALTRAQVDTLWRAEDVALREKALWRLLYESAARANEILGLDVADLDVANKRARVRSKAGLGTGCSGRPGPPASCPACSPDGTAARCSSPSANPPGRWHRRRRPGQRPLRLPVG